MDFPETGEILHLTRQISLMGALAERGLAVRSARVEQSERRAGAGSRKRIHKQAAIQCRKS